MSTYSKQLIASFFIMLFCNLVGMVLAISVGVATDQIHDTLVCEGIYNLGGRWSSYEMQSSYDAQFFITMIHVIIYTIPLIGTTIFILSAARKLRYDKYLKERDYIIY